MQKVTHEKLLMRRCPVSEVRQSYVDSQAFRNSLRNGLLALGGSAWLGHIERLVIGLFLQKESERTRITASDGTIYVKSNARMGSPLYGKWHKIPPGFRNISEAGNLATVVESPPEDLIKEEHMYCLHP